jgi:molybdate transport system ATP-binding protein
MRLDVNIQAQLGQFNLSLAFQTEAPCLALFGPSGAGKSLCLKAIAGIQSPQSGHIRLGDQSLFDGERCALSTQERRMGLVPQGSALFPHLSVRQNIAFGARDPRDVNRLAERFGIKKLLDQSPILLSGGESQRVALARALATRPQLLLLDEPFSGVDAQRRSSLIQALMDTVAEGTPMVFVTHELQDVLHLADEVALMDQGEVLQIGSVDQVLDAPSSSRAATLLGGGQVLDGTEFGHPSGTRVFLRSEWLRPLDKNEPPLKTEQLIQAKVHRDHRGPQTQVLTLELNSGAPLKADVPIWWWSAQSPKPSRVRLAIMRERLHLLREK